MAGMFDWLCRRGLLEWSRAAIDTYSLRAKRGGHVGPNPVDRRKPGSKLHLIIDALGVPLADAVTAANVHDSVLFEAMLDDTRQSAPPRASGAAGPPRPTLTRRMTWLAAAPTCADEASPRGLPARAWNPQ